MIAFSIDQGGLSDYVKDLCLWTGLLCRRGMLPGRGYIPDSAGLQIIAGRDCHQVWN